MIPPVMKEFINGHLPESLLETRVIREKDGKCRLELTHQDEQLLSTIGITADKLGPYLVALLWDEASDLEIGGYMVVDNLSMGTPAMGGIRMLPDITPLDIHNLARGMTLKNGAANLPFGGGKSGIVAPDRAVGPEEHQEIVRGWAKLLKKYTKIYVPGPDVGTNDADMKTVAVENGMDFALSKPADMGGNRIDELGGAAGGVVIALQTLLEVMPRLKMLPQFGDLEVPGPDQVTVMFQGFGAVGAHAARIMLEPDRLPQAKTVGLSDAEGYLYNPDRLPVADLFQMWKEKGVVTRAFYETQVAPQGRKSPYKFSTKPNDLLREDAFCLVPASSLFRYLGLEESEGASMLVSRMGDYRLIVEGANTYSPDPIKKALRARMEQVVYQQKGVMIANDYLVNSGGVIFAAQEYVVPTPEHLQIPADRLGKPQAVQEWLGQNAAEYTELSDRRRESAEAWREKVIRTNMIELVDLLTTNAEMLPCKAAEQISLGRLSAKDQKRSARDIMIPIATVPITAQLQEVARKIVESGRSLAAVVNEGGLMAGVINTWGITQSLSHSSECASLLVRDVMTSPAVTVEPSDPIAAILAKLEENRISAVPVVEGGKVLGVINTDILASRYYRTGLQ